MENLYPVTRECEVSLHRYKVKCFPGWRWFPINDFLGCHTTLTPALTVPIQQGTYQRICSHLLIAVWLWSSDLTFLSLSMWVIVPFSGGCFEKVEGARVYKELSNWARALS